MLLGMLAFVLAVKTLFLATVEKDTIEYWKMQNPSMTLMDGTYYHFHMIGSAPNSWIETIS